jgi:hypothetical protein
MNFVRFRLSMVMPFLTAFAPLARAQDSESPWKMEVLGRNTIDMRNSLTPPLAAERPDAGSLSPTFEGQSAAIGFDRMPLPFLETALGTTRVHSISASFDIPNEAATLPQVGLNPEHARDQWTFPVSVGASYRF